MMPFTGDKVVRGAFQDLKHDLKTTRWLRGLGWSVGVIWFSGLVICAIFIGLMSMFISNNTACLPDGSFRLNPDTYSMWSSSGFFQITLGGGELTFPQAKVVDIVWDIGVGRGGQLVMAIISWREFARYLTICMENEPVSYQVFRTIFIENDASVLSTCRTIKSFIWRRQLRSKVAMIFMTATMLFILAFPTLVSAMSGYDSNVASRIEDQDKNFIAFNSYSRVLYVVHDGWRIGQEGNHWITDQSYGDDPVLRYSTRCSSYRRYRTNDTVCDSVGSVSEYVTAYGVGGLLKEPSVFNNWTSGVNITLEAPVLNISAYRSDDEPLPGLNSSEILNMTWVRDNQTFDYEEIDDRGRCQNMGNYQWGFSFLQLFICIILLLTWTTGIYIMWIYTHYTLMMRNRLSDEVSGEHRAVLELAAAMQTELDIEDSDPTMLREKQLKDRIDKELKGGAIAYAYPDSALKAFSVRKGLKLWFKTEKWWFLAMFTTTVLCSTGWLFVYPFLAWTWLWSVWFGQFWAFCIGTTTGSRLLIILFWSLCGAIIVGAVSSLYY